ncbi:MAG: KH domain-containing protein [Microgenomates group bacterium]
MKDTLKKLISLFVDYPQDIQIEEEKNGQILVKANKKDIGTIIGKKGKTIKALQQLLKIKNKKRLIEIKIQEGS